MGFSCPDLCDPTPQLNPAFVGQADAWQKATVLPAETTEPCGGGTLGAPARNYRVYGNRAVGRRPQDGVAVLVHQQLIWLTPAIAGFGPARWTPYLAEGGILLKGALPARGSAQWRVRYSRQVTARRDARGGKIVFMTRRGRRLAELVFGAGSARGSASLSEPPDVGVREDADGLHISYQSGTTDESPEVGDVYMLATSPNPLDWSMCGRPTVPVPTAPSPPLPGVPTFPDLPLPDAPAAPTFSSSASARRAKALPSLCPGRGSKRAAPFGVSTPRGATDFRVASK